MVLEILTYPNPILRTKSKPCTDINDDIQSLIEDMSETMYASDGVGLAAIQIGSDLRIITYDTNPKEPSCQVIINPEIVAIDGEVVSENEGCLSVPGFTASIKRASLIMVEGLDRKGNPTKIEAEGLLSIVLQHEIDHLDGLLFVDRMSPLKKGLFKKRMKKKQKVK